VNAGFVPQNNNQGGPAFSVPTVPRPVLASSGFRGVTKNVLKRKEGSIGTRVWCLTHASAVKGRRTSVALIIRLKRQRAFMIPSRVCALAASLTHSLSLSLSFPHPRSCVCVCARTHSLLRARSLRLSHALSLSLSPSSARSRALSLLLFLTSPRPRDEQKVPSDRRTYCLSQLHFRA